MLSSDFTQPHLKSPPPPLIGALLRVPFESVRDRMLAGLHDRGYTDLVAAHLNVLQYPGPDDVRPSELAARTRMSKQALNYLLGQLQQLGYLTREGDDGDQRSRRIHLTARGRAAIEAIREIVQEVEAEWARQLGPRKFAQLRALLEQLQTAVAAEDRAAPAAGGQNIPTTRP
jgi:DNA-binding MarR family transcriptional regulator